MGSGDDRTTNKLDTGEGDTVRQDEPPVMLPDTAPAPQSLEESEREQTRKMGYVNDGDLARQAHDVPRQPAGGTCSSLGPNDESGQRSFAAEEGCSDANHGEPEKE